MSAELVGLVRKNTATSYMLVASRLLESILVTRWLVGYLGTELYGFWALLWSIFVFVLFLDFGFSKAAQKCTAEELYRADIDAYNQVVSSVFLLQWCMAAVIVGLTLCGVYFLPWLTRLSDPVQLSYCRWALAFFGVGVAVTFPTGMFPEILIGLKKIYLRNYVLVGGRIVSLSGILIILLCRGSLWSLIWFQIILNLSLNLVMLSQIRRAVPGFRLGRGSLATLRRLADFSVFNYLFSVASLVIHKTDRLVLSAMTGLNDVGIYQLGTRLPEMLDQMTMQYQSNIAPLTAELCRKNEMELLRNIVVSGLKFTAFLVSGGAALGVAAAPDVLQFLFKIDNPQVVEVCRVMLLSAFFSVSFRSFTLRIMMMAGYHRRLAAIYWCEAAVNLALSVFLVFRIGLMGVVYGTLIPNVVIALLVMLPFSAKFLGMTVWKLLGEAYVMPLFFACAAAACAAAVRRVVFAGSGAWGGTLCYTVCGGAIYLGLCLWGLFDSAERREMLARLSWRKRGGGAAC